MQNKSKSKSLQFLKFAITGAIGTVIDFGVMNLLTNYLNCDKLISQAISFFLAVINNFFLNRYWTFQKSRKSTFLHQFFSFLLISIIGLAIRTPLFWLFSKGITLFVTQAKISIINIPPEVLGNNLALAICIIIILLWNYFANRKWTFKAAEGTDENT